MKYASTDKLTGKADVQQEPTRLGILKSYAPFFVINAFFAVVGMEEQDLFPAYLRTKFSCPTPVPIKGVCPLGSLYDSGQCQPTPHGDPNWSGSAACMDKVYVVEKAVRFSGNLGSMASACKLVALVLLGTTMIDALGRKPAFIMSSVGLAVGVILMTVSCWISGPGGLNLIFLSSFCSAIMDCFTPASAAMASDIGGDDLTKRGVVLVLLHIIRCAGVIISFAIGYPILNRDITDYSRVFLAIAIVSVVLVLLVIFVLRETAPATYSSEQQPLKQSNPTSGSGEPAPASGVRKVIWVLQKGAQEMWAALCLNWSDGYLFWQLLVSAGNGIAFGGMFTITRSYSVGVVGLRQSTASLMGILNPAMGIGGAAASTLLMKTTGPFVTTFVGYGMAALGCVLAGLIPTLPVGAQKPVWWIGFGFFIGWGLGIVGPASTVCFSSRAGKGAHGKIFAAQGVVSTVGGLIGCQIWPKELFHMSTEHPWQSGVGYFVTAIILCICNVTQICAYFAHVRHTSRDRTDSTDMESAPSVH